MLVMASPSHVADMLAAVPVLDILPPMIAMTTLEAEAAPTDLLKKVTVEAGVESKEPTDV